MEPESEPDAFIEADDGRKTPCSLREAQCWLYQGYFASSTRIALRGKDGRMCLWRTLEELVKRNGRAMPFCEWMSNEEEEELTSLHEEIIEQNRQKECLKRAIEEIRERFVCVREELNRIEMKFSDLDLPEAASSTVADAPVEAMSISAVAVTPDFLWDAAVGTAKMSEQEPAIKTEETPGRKPVVRTEKAPDPKLEVGTEKSSETVVRTERTQDPEPASAIALNENESVKPRVASNDEHPTPRLINSSPFSPPPGVDPLALLKSCEGAKRKMPIADVARCFKELRALFDRCDIFTLIEETGRLYPEDKLLKCSFCVVYLETINNMICHLGRERHIFKVEQMNGSVCADAFDFWWRAIKSA
ncbi:hypothetical protein PRIPAC_89199, partial [Pristionchus pacificus]